MLFDVEAVILLESVRFIEARQRLLLRLRKFTTARHLPNALSLSLSLSLCMPSPDLDWHDIYRTPIRRSFLCQIPVVPALSQGEAFKGDSYPLCQGVPLIQCCTLSHITS